MTITYSWSKKKLFADYFGIVSQIDFERKGIKENKTEKANAVLVIPEDDQEHADKWTEDRLDDLAETYKENLDAEIKRRIEALEKA
tara:strand:+ start:73 stop:330 length:258 start_codon:yes stop_codon:yes gene_type:complete